MKSFGFGKEWEGGYLLKRLKANNYRLIYGIFIVFYLWMAAQVPYAYDDWDWGISNGIEQLLYATVNARYAGNFFVVIMTRSQILKTLIMGAGYFLIPYGLAFFAVMDQTVNQQEQKLCAFLLANILFFTMCREIWRQTYGWVAGFANYSVSAVFMLVWIREIKLTFLPESEKSHVSVRELLVCVTTSFLGQMFLENLAIFTVLLGLFLCVARFVKNQKIPMKTMLMLLGAILGLLVVFSCKLYGSLWSTGEAVGGYRNLSVGNQYSLTTTIYMLLSQAALLAPLIFEENIVQCLLILGLLSILLLQRMPKKTYAYILCGMNGFFAVCFLYCFVRGSTTVEFGKFVPLVINGAFFLTVAAETVLLLYRDKSSLGVALTAWFSVPGVILPLVFTLETSYRLFFTSNTFMTLFAIILLQQMKAPGSLRRAKILFLTGALLLMCSYGYVYHAIGVCKRERDALMEQATKENASSVTLPGYPFAEYLWVPNPVGEKRQGYFRSFYNLPEDIEIHIQF